MAMPYRIFVQDTASAPWREIKQLDHDGAGMADIDRLGASGRYHAIELRHAARGDVPVYVWPRAEVAQAA
jgi:hypothetical protein